MVFLTLNYIFLRVYNLKLIYGNILSTNNGILTLGKDKPAIFTKIVQVAFVASKVLKTLEGSKDIYTVINGVATTVRMYLAKGEVISLNAFVGYSARTLGEAIDLKNKRF